MRNGIPNRNLTTRANADTRPTLRDFTSLSLIRKIANHELRGYQLVMIPSCTDSVWRLIQVVELKHEERTKESKTALQPLMIGHHIEHNSAGSLRISDPPNGRISKTLIYGKIKNRQSICKIGMVQKR